MVGRWGREPVAMSAFLKRIGVSPTSQRIGCRKTRGAEKDIDALDAQPLGGVIFGDPGADTPHARHDRLEIHRRVRRCRGTVFLGSRHDHPDTGRADDRLGGNGTGIEGIAAQPVPFDERHPRPEAYRPFGRRQAGRAAADDDQVVERLGHGIDPVDGPHAPQQIVFVVGGLGRLGTGDGHGYSHPPVKPARCRPVRMAGQRRMRSQMKPLR